MVDGSGSTDADGTIASYAWNFGDGATATGATATHTYATAGTRTVTLTVTDNAGATGTVSHPVTVTTTTPPPPTGGTLAKDTFARTVTGGLGTAETGGTWTTSGTASDFAVNNGVAKITTPAGSNRYAYLNTVSSTDTDLSATLSFTRPASSSVYTGLIGRRVGTATYGARAVVGTSGAVLLQLQRNTDQILAGTTVPGLAYATGDQLQFRLQVTGTNPTTIQAKAWKTGTTEPAGWNLTTTDTTAALQAAGGIGLYSYLSSSATPTPQTITWDNLTATTTQ
jgi:PKD repeat protein